MSKHTIIGVIILMSISLLGVVGLQLYWINDAIKVKQEQFDRSVNAALTKVVEKIETHEAVSVVAHQMAALNNSTPVPPTDTVEALAPPAADVSAQAPPASAKQAKKPVESGTKAQLKLTKASVSISADPKEKPAQQTVYRGVATAHGGAPADYIYIAPAGNVSVQYSRADSILRKKSLKERDKRLEAALATAAVPAFGSYLNVIRSIPDSLYLRHPKGNVLELNRMLQAGNVYQLGEAQERRRLSDSVATMFRMRQGEPIRISVDTLRHLAMEMENLKEIKLLPITVGPSAISSVDVRHDSIIIYRTDNARQTHFRRQAIHASGKAANTSILYTEAAPSRKATPLKTKTQKESKVAKPVKVISGGNRTVAASPNKLPNAKTNASSIEKIDIKKDKLNDVVQKMVVEYAVRDEPLQQRLNLHGLQQLLKTELQQQGIQLDFGYWVVSGQTDTVVAQNLMAISNRALPSYKATLFPNDIFDKPDYLGLYFPDSKTYALKSLWGMLSLSALFTFVIIATFGTTIHIIYKQKKLSEMKNDFINNMTHEFKTPIATISLATDSITNPKVYENPDRIKYYTGIIREENKRMNAQVENVLQIAQLEKNEFRMNLQPVDVHALIIKAIEGIRLQVEQRLGHINVHLEALQHELRSDEVHLYNVICNLLDNANKYSPASPDIHLVTKNVNGGILIAVEDKGIGMSKDTQQRVFEKFYRVPTGNLHNVKGFGLGLSYVKAIVQAHHGDIKLKSELGKGSRFEIFLPFA